jgi:peptidoglycan hydrolase CwlO-like protein
VSNTYSVVFDQELKEFIGKTEDVLLQSETQVQYCQEDIRSLEERLLLWSSTLEQIEDITPRNTESSMKIRLISLNQCWSYFSHFEITFDCC